MLFREDVRYIVTGIGRSLEYEYSTVVFVELGKEYLYCERSVFMLVPPRSVCFR